jgi:hypothetical protein
VTLGRRDLDEAREEQWNGSCRRDGAGLRVAEGGAVLDRLGVAEGVVEVQGGAVLDRLGGAVHAGGGQGVEVSERWTGGDRAHGSGAVAARGADLSRVRERERGRARGIFLDKTISSVGSRESRWTLHNFRRPELADGN